MKFTRASMVAEFQRLAAMHAKRFADATTAATHLAMLQCVVAYRCGLEPQFCRDEVGLNVALPERAPLAVLAAQIVALQDEAAFFHELEPRVRQEQANKEARQRATSDARKAPGVIIEFPDNEQDF